MAPPLRKVHVGSACSGAAPLLQAFELSRPEPGPEDTGGASIIAKNYQYYGPIFLMLLKSHISKTDLDMILELCRPLPCVDDDLT